MGIVIIFPLALRSVKPRIPSDDEFSFEPVVVTDQNDKEWRRMLRETRKCCKGYEKTYGVKVYGVKRFSESFIEINCRVTDKEKFSKYGEFIDETIFCRFLNNESDPPSFYKNNLEDNKYVDSFSGIFHPW